MKKTIAKRTKIELEVGLDENHVPVDMKWHSDDSGEGGTCTAAMLALWDDKEESTLRIDLWDKEMNIYDMQRFFHQALLTMGDTYERATNNGAHAKDIRDFAERFAVTTGIKS